MLGNDHWLNCPNKNRPTLFHSLQGWLHLHPRSLRTVLIILSKHWHYTLSTSKVKNQKWAWISVTYSVINSVLLLKTPGGSSFIWLSLKPLRKHIPRFYLKLYSFLCVTAVAYIFGMHFIFAVPGSNKRFYYNLECDWTNIYIYIYINTLRMGKTLAPQGLTLKKQQ